jgi:hypothetical protein
MSFSNATKRGIEDSDKILDVIVVSADLTLDCIVGKLSWEIS